MGLKEEFLREFNQFKRDSLDYAHVSSPPNYNTCASYRNILAMGKDVLPLLEEAKSYDSSKDFALHIVQTRGLPSLVERISSS
ncbi:hypothetical protein KW787_01140 [Candidatus Pacearchaeota archaeon]|nr:hypothetical protein [Candidatus Pacearchaeota archaeon]